MATEKAAKPSRAATSDNETPTADSKKRKSALNEIEVDLALPEPPSKKARRALKKGKPLPEKHSSGDEDDEEEEADGGSKPGKSASAADGPKKPKERSPYGVWIGNLPFTATRADLRRWLVDNSGGVITADLITRVHLPTSSRGGGAHRRTRDSGGGGDDDDDENDQKAGAENKGFAYVDFATFEANVAAIALSEADLGGRKLLIKDSKSFAGRPAREPGASGERNDGAAAGTDSPAGAGRNQQQQHQKPASRKVFIGNLGFNVTDDDVHNLFEKCGDIEWVKVATFEDTGKCKGYGWVKFKEAEAAEAAMRGFVKIQEVEETEEDFMDGAAAAADGEEEEEEAEAEGRGGGEEDGGKPAKQPKKTRTRKWWVNMLKGRSVKVEYAEDDQVRYSKRFGKGASKKGNDRPTRPAGARTGTGAAGEDGAGSAAQSRDKIKFQDDLKVARLTGAAVAPQGKKTTFD